MIKKCIIIILVPHQAGHIPVPHQVGHIPVPHQAGHIPVPHQAAVHIVRNLSQAVPVNRTDQAMRYLVLQQAVLMRLATQFKFNVALRPQRS